MSEPLASIDINQGFQNLLDTVIHSVPKILVFLAVLIVGWIIAKALAKVVDVVLRRVKFDHFVERGAVGQALARSNTDATMLIAKIVYYAIMLIALQMAFGVFGTNPISTMLNAIVAWLPRAIVGIIIIVIASAIAKVVKDLVMGAIGGLSYGPFLANMASVIIIALGAIAALNQVGIAGAITTPILDTVLITCGAVIAIGVGGGLVKPMQERWERMLTVAERETNSQLAAYQQGRSDAMRAPDRAARQRQEAPAGAQGYGPPRGAPGHGDPGYGGPAQGGPPQSGGPVQDPGDWRGPGGSFA